MALLKRRRRLHDWDVTNENALRKYELEESAQGSDLYRAPGAELQVEDARDQAEASGWIPESNPDVWPRHLARAKKHHLTLRDAMGNLEQVMARPAARVEWHGQVDQALADLAEALEDHVQDVEGEDGLLVDVEKQAPRLTAEAQLLRDEHATVSRTLLNAHNTVRGSEAVASADPGMVRRRVMALLGRLMLHRQRAADLVYEAYNVDIAAGD